MNMLSSVTTFQHEQTRTISPENMTGEKGKSCMAASHLGQAVKGVVLFEFLQVKVLLLQISKDRQKYDTCGLR